MSSTKPFGADNAKNLKVIRQKAKDRWLVCHEDSFEGDSNTKAVKKSGERVNRIVGVAAIIVNAKNEILVGERAGSHGAGTLALPGGHIDDKKHPEDKDDSIENLEVRDAVDVEKQAQTTAREVKEETNLVIKPDAKHVHTTWDYFEENKKDKAGLENYNTFFMWCEMADKTAQPVIKEPNKCNGWRWMSWKDLKDMLNNKHKVDDDAGAPDGPAATSDQGERLFLPLAKLVRDFPDLDTLRP